MSYNNPYAYLLAYKQWADLEMLDNIGSDALSEKPDQRDLILRTLNHIYVVDTLFQYNMQGISHDFTSLNTPETPAIAELKNKVISLDRWYVEYCDQLDEKALDEQLKFKFVSGNKGVMSRREMLQHVVVHSAYHRGAVSHVLEHNGLSSPKDTLTVFLNKRS